MAILGYAEMLMEDAVQAGRVHFTDDLQRILDAGRTLHRLILSLLDPATIHRTDSSADQAQFRRTLRHDLRTPINAIKGYAEMLREDAADGSADLPTREALCRTLTSMGYAAHAVGVCIRRATEKSSTASTRTGSPTALANRQLVLK